MTIFEWQKIPYQERLKIRAKYGIKPSGQVVTISRISGDIVQDDGIKIVDLLPIKTLDIQEVLASVTQPKEKILIDIPLKQPIQKKEKLKRKKSFMPIYGN